MSKFSWKTMSLRDKILGGVACAICLVIIAFIIYSIAAVAIAFAPKEAAPTDTTEYDFVFVGSFTALEEEYDIQLKGKDGNFTVDANKIKDVTSGTYTFTEGQGWTFSFADKNGTVVRTQYDGATKTFGFIYALDLGSRGVGNLRLSYTVESFDAAAQPWSDIPSFAGTAGWFGGGVQAPIVLSCDADNNFKVFGTGGEITVIAGTYAQSGDAFVFTSEDGTVYTSAADAETGLQAVEIEVFRPALEAYGPVAYTTVTLTQVVLTVD